MVCGVRPPFWRRRLLLRGGILSVNATVFQVCKPFVPQRAA
ncbi:hypothetical protein HMPREF9120_02138 [Neisseria sp. oral taxon 020 str. F0370]|nr:hypothetical protein HMPREF9120_02138 [Neisseria sp. oral taxon 020 str. F0370]